MSVGLQDGVLSKGIVFGIGFASLGGMSLAGSRNWFELLNTTETKREKRKMASDYHWIKMNQEKNDKKIVEEKSSKKIVEEKSSKKKKQQHRASSFFRSAKAQKPEIRVRKASVESDLSESWELSTDENESDDCVYEFPGLAASAEDMTVENPLFNEKLFQKCYRTPELPRRFWKDVFTETI